MLSHVRLFATLWTVACQAPLSMGFLRREYWSGLPFPSPGELPDPGIEPHGSKADSLPLHHLGNPRTLLGNTKVSLDVKNTLNFLPILKSDTERKKSEVWGNLVPY